MFNENEEIISRKPFDIQEAVVLLDVYLLEKENNLSRTEATGIASVRLRNLAVQRGMVVSASFRSPVGLQNRLRSIEGIFEGKESASTPGTEAFRKAVALYRNDKEQYQRLLDSAGVPVQSIEKKAKNKRSKAVRTKFVRTKKDQLLKDKYSGGFNDVYYALKKISMGTNAGVTATDIFLHLERRVKRKDILDILDKASWSKTIASGHYVFYDKEKIEREKQKMDETLKTGHTSQNGSDGD